MDESGAIGIRWRPMVAGVALAASAEPAAASAAAQAD